MPFLVLPLLAATFAATIEQPTLDQLLAHAREPQQRALRVLEASRPVPTDGSNGYAALWTLGYSVDPANAEARLARFVANAWSAADNALPFDFAGAVALELEGGALPALADKDQAALCALRGARCLEHVRVHATDVALALDRHARRLDNARAIARFRVIAATLPERLDEPLPDLAAGMRLELTWYAQRFATGHRDEAIAGLCRSVEAWRRLRTQTNHLVFDMVGVAYLAGAAQLHAEMLVQGGNPLDPDCAGAFAALRDVELDQCEAMRHEYRTIKREVASLMPELEQDSSPTRPATNRMVGALTLRVSRTVALVAPGYAAGCLTGAALRAPAVPIAAPACEPFDYLFNAAGCLFTAFGAPAVGEYHDRLLDLDARFALTRYAAASAAGRDASWPALPHHAVHDELWDERTSGVVVDLIYTRSGATWSVPVMYRRGKPQP